METRTKELPLPFDADFAPVKLLKAGTLTCMYELGTLRYIRIGTTEVLRKIYGAVRKDNWDTVPCNITNEEVTITADGFSIRYTAVYYEQYEIYQADFSIEGNADNSIRFSMKGFALAPFLRNRIGLCVLHPVKECSNKMVTVTRPDGSQYESLFPVLVSPVQPFLQVQEMQWGTNGINVQLIFEGETFETEDQRNWSDSSYKTYSTPHDIPKPVLVNQGDTIQQSVLVKVHGGLQDIGSAVETREEKLPFPGIGYAKSRKQPMLDINAINWLSRVPFNHYRVTIVLNDPSWRHELQEALVEAELLNTGLQLVVYFSGAFEEETASLIHELTDQSGRVKSILVLQHKHVVTAGALIRYTYPILKKELPGIAVGYGTDGVFADLNMNRPGQLPCDFLSFGLHPLAHAFDDRTLLENLQNQQDLLATVKHFAPGKQVHVSPVTLKARAVHEDHVADKRQHTWLCAFWTLMTLQNLSSAHCITFFELFGDAGILQSTNAAGIKPSPIYEVLSAIHTFNPVYVIKQYAGEDLLQDGLLLENRSGERIFFKAPPGISQFSW